MSSSCSQWVFLKEEKLFIKFTGNEPYKLAKTAAAPSIRYNMWEALHLVSCNNRILEFERGHKDHLVPHPSPPCSGILSTRPGCSEIHPAWLPLFKLLSETAFTFRRHWHFLRRKHRVFFFHQAKKRKKNIYIYLMMLENKRMEKKTLVKMYSVTFQFPYPVFEKVLSFSKKLSENFPGKIMSIRSQITLTLED